MGRSGSYEPAVGGRVRALVRPRLRYASGTGDSTTRFGLRLLATVALTFAMTGLAAYFVLTAQLRAPLYHSYLATQRDDARNLEAPAHSGAQPAVVALEVSQLLNTMSRRPGVTEALLVDPQGVVTAAGTPVGLGTKVARPEIVQAIARGREYAGMDAGGHHLEFVVPVNLPGGRYAFQTKYRRNVLDAQVRDVERSVIIVGLLAFLVGSAIFYLVGGRALMRSHRLALHRATRDGLTDLPNHRAFEDEFLQAVVVAARSGDPLATLLIDVDQLTRTNDRQGFAAGDAQLRRVAAVLRDGRTGDRVYRIGDDEFALVLPHTDAEGARARAGRLNRALAKVGAEASIGVSTAHDGQSAQGLRAEAEAALQEAKRQGGNRAAHFDDIRSEVVVSGPEKREAVRRLITEGRLITEYQPIWDLASGALLGLEALTRPDRSYDLSGPAEAFDIANQIGHVHDLDVLCVKNSLEIGAELPEGTLLFVNVSPRTLDVDGDHDDWLLAAVRDAGLAPENVVVEVTERFGGGTDSIVGCLHHLRSQGFRLALDDVGTGNAGLELLRKVDAEFVKIDRSIVIASSTEPNARAVLMAVATFAHQTGAFVIAEGIEDQEGLDKLQLQAAEVVQGGQGYGLGRPSPNVEPATPGILRHPSQSS